MSQHCAEIDCPLLKKNPIGPNVIQGGRRYKKQKHIKKINAIICININMDQKSEFVYHIGYCLTLGIYGYKSPKLQTCLESKQCMNSV